MVLNVAAKIFYSFHRFIDFHSLNIAVLFEQ
jgi:hypothetical protein